MPKPEAEDPDSSTLFIVRLPKDSGHGSCQGRYWFDPQSGYHGRLFISDYQIAPGAFSNFTVPDALDGALISAETEQGKFVTICYPRFRRQKWHSFSTLVLEFSFSMLVEDLHIGADDADVKRLLIGSPSLASLTGIRPVTHTLDGFTAGTATFAIETPTSWPSENYQVTIADEKRIGGTEDASEVHFRSGICLCLEYHTARNMSAAIRDLRMVDDLLAVMAGTYVECDRASIRIQAEGNAEAERRSFALSGYGSQQRTKSFVHWHDALYAQPLSADWGQTVERFSVLWEQHAIPFKWFRSAQVNERYLEEKFSYAIRVAERFFRPSRQRDADSSYLLSAIRQRLFDEASLVQLVERRIAPMLAGAPSLVETLTLLFDRYPFVVAFAEGDPRAIVRLRGREMHGADNHYSSTEYQLMYDVSNALLLAFRIAILEECGFELDHLTANARRSSAFRHMVTAA